MRNLYHTLLTFFLIGTIHTALLAQGFEQNMYELQSADLITEVGGDTFLINSSLNQFQLIGRHGEILENILHSNNVHPDDIHVGEELRDLHPYPMPNGDIAFFSRKRIDTALVKSDVLYFNYRDGNSQSFTVQTTLFLPESLTGISDPGYTQVEDYTFLNGHFYFSGVFHTVAGEDYPVLMKVNLDGALLWANTYLLSYSANGEISRLRAIETTEEDRVLLALEYADFEYYHLEVDEDGQEAGGVYFPLMDELSGLEDAAKTAYWIQPDGGLIIVGNATEAGEDDLFVFDANAALTFSRPWSMGLVNQSELYRVIRQVEGGFLVYYLGWEPVEGNTESITISKVDLAGDLLWAKTYVPKYYLNLLDITELESGNIVFAGVLSVFLNNPFPQFYTQIGYLLKLGPEGELYGSIFEGQTFEDIDLDCGPLVEAPIGSWLVAFQNEIDTFYVLSNAMGEYERPVLPGTYETRLYPLSPYWSGCPPEDSLEIGYKDTLTHHFPAQALVDCPDLAVNISAPFLRRCFESTYTINYCNTGTALAQDAYIEVELDPELVYVSATLAPSSIQGQLLRFELGAVDMGQCGDFQLTVEVNCDGVLLGQTHCTTATIFPNAPCTIPPDWSGASLKADARCEGDSVALVIKNVGDAATAETVKYFVIEDQVILQEGDVGILQAEDSLELRFFADGSTYRLEVEQEANHPGNSFPTASIEGCASDPNFPISLGIITQYWENDLDPFVSVDCQENIGSYDPNDKRAYPGGVEIGNKHYIESNQRINYHIRFQNTGTDTAFTVVIEDQIDPNLDLATLRLGAYSHPYSLEVTPLRELIFTFNDIRLVDSLTNEPLSHGFVSFSLEQLPDLPEGTQIENQAAIFFDFNLPIYTNTWVHEIKEDILPYAEMDEPPALGTAAITISPNPLSETAEIALGRAEPDSEVRLMIYDSRGVLCQRLQFENNVFQFNRNSLPDGLYIIEAFSEGKSLGIGKLVVQN